MTTISLSPRSREFRRRLEQVQERLYRMAFAWCHETNLAHDLVQETNTKALERWGQLRGLETFDAWVFRILANCCKDHYRCSRDIVALDEWHATARHELTPEYEQSRHQTVAQVREAVAALPAGQRQLLTLVDLEGFTYKEVAQILDLPMGTVMSRLCRARRALKGRIERLAQTHRLPRIRSVK